MTGVGDDKRTLRRRLRAARRAIPDDQRAAAHERIVAHLRCLLDETPRPGGAVALYAAMPEEADARGLITTLPPGSIAWPRVTEGELELVVCDQDALVVGYQGLREPPAGLAPLSPTRLRLLVVPGLGFDALGRRLGQGGGFYDRLLARVRADPHPCLIVGIAYQVQILPEIPTAPHDQPVDLVVTEHGPVGPVGLP